MEQAAKLTVRIEAEGADEEELDDLTRELLVEVREGTNVEAAELAFSATAPAGAKSGGMADLGTVLVQALPAAVPGLLAALRAWASRHRGSNVTVSLAVGGRSLNVQYPVGSMTHDDLMDLVAAMRAEPRARPGSRGRDRS